jgi:hypothetical protein
MQLQNAPILLVTVSQPTENNIVVKPVPMQRV